MNNDMQLKEYLETPFYMNQKIDLKIDKLAMLQAAAIKTTASISATTGGSGNYQKMESNVVKITELKEEIRKDIVILLETENKVEKTIKLIGDDRLELILMARYIFFESWEDIATNLNYSKRYIYKLHDKALEILNDRKQDTLVHSCSL